MFKKEFNTILCVGLMVCLLLPFSLTGAPQEQVKKEGEKEFEADKGPDTIDVSGYPEEMQQYYKTFYKRCSKCHSIARPINTDFDVAKWNRYVKRMMRKPGSGITSKTGKKIFLFLKYHTEQKAKKKEN